MLAACSAAVTQTVASCSEQHTDGKNLKGLWPALTVQVRQEVGMRHTLPFKGRKETIRLPLGTIESRADLHPID